MKIMHTLTVCIIALFVVFPHAVVNANEEESENQDQVTAEAESDQVTAEAESDQVTADAESDELVVTTLPTVKQEDQSTDVNGGLDEDITTSTVGVNITNTTTTTTKAPRANSIGTYIFSC